jgi:predicted Fe-Mo cluster-binding NifX family protein
LAAKAAVEVLVQAGVRHVAARRFGQDALTLLADAGIEPTLMCAISLGQFEELWLHESNL